MLIPTTLLLLAINQCLATDVSVTISTTATTTLPPTLWGQAFEDINAGDGGLYAELIQNRAFQQVSPNTTNALTAWHSISGATLNVIQDPVPISAALPNALQVTFPAGRLLPTGFGNEGYFGIKIDSTITYNASFFYKFPQASTFTGNATVGLQSASGLSMGSVTVPLNGSRTAWTQVNVTIKPSLTGTTFNNFFAITLDSRTLPATQTINFVMVSLFPPTFKNRPNGMRIDLANALVEMAPSFLRFPGGNNLGNSVADRWRWNATVGNLVDRPGRVGSWGYINSDGLGLFEFLRFAEDINATPIMAVYSGLSLDGSTVDESDIFPFIQEAIDQINFAVGSATATDQGKLRAAMGHPTPFNLTFVEIGSEDFQSSDTYMTRWQDFATILSLTFPQIRFIATSNANNPVLAPDPTHWDVHVSQTPQWFVQNSFFYDGFQRNGTSYLQGAYAAVSTDDGTIGAPNDPARLTLPTVQSALSEAVFMLGLERNADIVIGASYAPLFNNLGGTQETPSLISFDAGNVVRSTSFYIQKLFSTNRGLQNLPSTKPNPTGTVFWNAVKQNTDIILKVVNIDNTAMNVIIAPGIFVERLQTIIIKGLNATQSNSVATPSAVVPASLTISLPFASTVTYVSAPFSLGVLRMSLS